MAEESDAVVAFFDYGEEDRKLLRALRPLLEESAGRLVAAFYRRLLSFSETQRYLRDPEVTKRLLDEQRRYLLSLAGPELDEAYIRERRRIGEAHERIGLDPSWYIGAYAHYLEMLTPLVVDRPGTDSVTAYRTLSALQKLILFDVHMAMKYYMERRERDLQRINDELARVSRGLARDLESTGAELRSAARRAQAAEQLASIGVLVAGLAHEIGTPMGVIQGHAKLLESAVEGQDAQWRLRTIQEQIGRISRIMESLLGMARPSRPQRVPLALAPLLENTLAFVREKLARREIEAELDLGEVDSVPGDPERLQQVVLNLLLNAADAMPEGGRLRVRLQDSGEGEAEVLVSDTGPGIPAAERARIFDPFVTSKEAGEGHGLGLAVAKSIMTEHGGSIEVAETGPGGTTFRLRLPYQE